MNNVQSKGLLPSWWGCGAKSKKTSQSQLSNKFQPVSKKQLKSMSVTSTLFVYPFGSFVNSFVHFEDPLKP